jgi:hypothetical protein
MDCFIRVNYLPLYVTSESRSFNTFCDIVGFYLVCLLFFSEASIWNLLHLRQKWKGTNTKQFISVVSPLSDFDNLVLRVSLCFIRIPKQKIKFD